MEQHSPEINTSEWNLYTILEENVDQISNREYDVITGSEEFKDFGLKELQNASDDEMLRLSHKSASASEPDDTTDSGEIVDSGLEKDPYTSISKTFVADFYFWNDYVTDREEIILWLLPFGIHWATHWYSSYWPDVNSITSKMLRNLFSTFIEFSQPEDDEQNKEQIKLVKDSSLGLQECLYSLIDSSLCQENSKIQFIYWALEMNRRESEMRQPIRTHFERTLLKSIITLLKLIKMLTSTVLLTCSICFITVLCARETGGESINVTLAKKPVFFDTDVDLICTIQTPDTPGHMAWIKMPKGETLAVNNKTSDNSKYNIDMKYESSAMKYTLRIKRFAQSDVNFQYRCDSGFLSQYQNLQLNKEDYIAMPEKNAIEQKISISDGHLLGTIQVNSVYPEPDNCAAIFEGEDITSQMKLINSSTPIDSIFYNMVIEINHITEKCNGMINVTCYIGIKRIPLMEKDLDDCSKQSPETRISYLVLGTVLPSVLVVIVVVVLMCFLKERASHTSADIDGPENAETLML